MAHAVTLGDGLNVSQLGFGGMALTPVYGEVDQEDALRTLHHAVDSGVSFIDTADIYGGGSNEELIARLLKARRDEVQLATKFGLVGTPADGYTDIRGDAAYIRQAVDRSLRRLGTDVIDLYYMHRRDLRVPMAETVGAMAELVQQGKVRHLGLSEVTAQELAEASAVHPIAAVQSEWSIWSRDVERNVVPAAASLGVGFVPYSPLGRGFLTGTVDASSLGDNDFRRRIPRFAPDAAGANQAVVDTVQSVADQLDATPAQVALAWLLAQGRGLGLPVVPIPGTRKAHRID
jgi:aryl-alcohol dehydrogenase-like predicted oxidoreductase